MKEPYGEGVASHTDSESCVVSREAGHEALTGAHVGGVLSREMPGNQDADAVLLGGKATLVGVLSRAPTGPARSKAPDSRSSLGWFLPVRPNTNWTETPVVNGTDCKGHHPRIHPAKRSRFD